jgi:peroxidase
MNVCIEIKWFDFAFGFSQGCDASVTIQPTPGNTAEKDYTDNLSLAGDGFDTVMKAKQAVENVCRNKVSCADILTMDVRDVVALVSDLHYHRDKLPTLF